MVLTTLLYVAFCKSAVFMSIGKYRWIQLPWYKQISWRNKQCELEQGVVPTPGGERRKLLRKQPDRSPTRGLRFGKSRLNRWQMPECPAIRPPTSFPRTADSWVKTERAVGADRFCKCPQTVDHIFACMPYIFPVWPKKVLNSKLSEKLKFNRFNYCH